MAHNYNPNRDHKGRFAQGSKSDSKITLRDEQRANNLEEKGPLDFSGRDLRHERLLDMNLRGANMAGANLQGMSLSGLDLSGADLSGAKLVGATLFRADLSGADLRRANMVGAYLVDANLSGANMQWADMRGVNMKGSKLTGAKLMSANLRESKLTEADFSEADLTGAKLRGSTMQGASFKNATMASGMFMDADKFPGSYIIKSDRPVGSNAVSGGGSSHDNNSITVYHEAFPYYVIDSFDTLDEALSEGFTERQIWSVVAINDENGSNNLKYSFGPPHHVTDVVYYACTLNEHDGKTYYEEPIVLR